ncbi:hypothetical protein HXX76_007630 [Chlamydomonas incerta]|uniref:Uncharacterized protein n=1 Tax=Chlamydomonas incerta TaxID=51695 RepID=A0A835W3N2_CHLIN|nr:hypothetical protein HXX76_007630 [Chlamydomonas incerta]|eukprot:KAG2434741.1 hypothetical protein HXX76_007630 [Chlamydomonas incerta]
MPTTRSRAKAGTNGSEPPATPGAASADADAALLSTYEAAAAATAAAAAAAETAGAAADAAHPLTPAHVASLKRPGGSLDELCRLQYDADGEPAAARDHVHVHGHRRRADAPPASSELGGMALLVLLYMVQGVPLGLTTGALPFMLSSKLSYTQMGIFGLAAYPYSLKLLWSPIVDSVYFKSVGRRKSWIVPIQLLTAALLLGCAGWIQRLYEAADVVSLTGLFLVFVFLMATQDIAVDGWALTLLSPANVSYASTCQTVGQTSGIFTSFTVFLALQDAAFCNKYIRANSLLGPLIGATSADLDVGLVSLAGYMRFWGWVFAAVTAAIALFVRERSEQELEAAAAVRLDADTRALRAPLSSEERELLGMGDAPGPGASGLAPASGRSRSPSPATPLAAKAAIATATSSAAGADPASGALAGTGSGSGSVMSELADAYMGLWRVVRLPAVWRLSALLLTYRLGVLAAEGAASLKLIDKGVAKEALAFLVLFQFPVELLSAVVAGRWAASHSPYWPFMTGYVLRLATAAATVALTAAFPAGATSLSEHRGAFGALAAVSLATSFVSYLSFTALGSFFNTVSDPAMGGAYLTLLNTIANMGYLLPRTPMFWFMDMLTVPRCTAAGGAEPAGAVLPHDCPKKLSDMARGDSECAAAGGVCGLASDGYYILSSVSLVVGAGLGLAYLGFVWRLMRLPLSSWRATAVRAPSGGAGLGDAEVEAEKKKL